MPVIVEEPDVPNADFNELLNLPDSTFAETDGNSNEADATFMTTNASLARATSHAADDGELIDGFTSTWDLPQVDIAPTSGVEEPDYSRFEDWIPLFFRPEKPCDYCRSRRLNCYLQRGDAHCTPCKSLFRECSLSNSNTLEATNYTDKNTGTFLDTLHAVDEDAVQDRGFLTGIKPLNSKGRSSGTNTPIRDDAPGSTKRNGIRFPRHAVKTLRDWLEAHGDNPYPTEEEKVELENQTELKPSQVANWLANARRRRKASDKMQPKLCQSPSLRPSTGPIAIPSPNKPWDELNPFERWKNSPPENEPASMTDIANAVASNELLEDAISTSPSTLAKRGKRSSNGSELSNLRAPSTTSLETGQTSSLSNSNTQGSAHSRSTHGSFGSFSSSLAGKKDRKRRRRPITLAPGRKLSDDKKRIFQCTFCTDTFKSKYDWTRHEKSLHLSLEKWICAPLGPVITDQHTQVKRCVYCDCQDPSDEHFESHNHRQCDDKGLDGRTFYRKDHLRQHLRLFHDCTMTPFMDSWRFTSVQINSRCGFCAQRFTVWQERVDHLTAHFKAGARMADWKGCRGLDPAVAAQVTNAMPPYLIGIESVSPIPFSATNRASWRCPLLGEFEQAANIDKCTQGGIQDSETHTFESSGFKANCWEILTVRLGKYAKEMAEKEEIMTDDMLQAQARRIVYDSEDSWNQTAADNPEWLDLFKKAHGLDFIPREIGGQGLVIPEDLETYGDLGLRIPFAVQLQAYNQSKPQPQVQNSCNVPGPVKEALQRRQTAVKDVYSQLAREGVLHDEDGRCDHSECSKNVVNLDRMDPIESSDFGLKRWCSHDISPETLEIMENIVKHGFDNGEEVLWSQEKSSNIVKDKGHVSAEDLTDHALVAARARARGLDALSRAEAPIHDDCHIRHQPPSDSSVSAWRGFLPRHKYQLPKNRAQCFETVTGPWQDSGKMPNPELTAPPSIEQPYHTSTGAMMEFLGGDIGCSLPFSNDALTSTIPLPELESADDLIGDLNNMSEEQIDELIRTTTSVDVGISSTAMDTTWTSAEVARAASPTMLPDVNMEELSFNEMAFDDVFDMPIDDTFEL